MADIEGVLDATTLENLAAEAERQKQAQEKITVPDTNIEGQTGYADFQAVDESDNMILAGRAAFHRTMADYAESVPIANEFDWWKRRVVEPWREEQHRLESNIKYEGFADRIAGELAGGFIGLGMTLPVDMLLGGSILRGARLLNPKLYSVLTATRKAGALKGTQYLPTWGLGMTARRSAQTFHATDHDLIATGIAAAESTVEAVLFGAMPRSVIGGTWGMFTMGVASRGYEDIKEGHFSDPSEYLYSAANFVGMHAALGIAHKIGMDAPSERERSLGESLAFKMKQGKAALGAIEEALADPDISSHTKENLIEMRTQFAMELSKDFRRDKIENNGLAMEEVFPLEDLPKAKFLNSGLVEKGIEEALMSWERGEVELYELIMHNDHVNTAIEEGYIEYDDGARTWNWNPDLIPTPNSNVRLEAGKEPKFKKVEALGSTEFPISPSERGFEYIMDRMGMPVVGEVEHANVNLPKDTKKGLDPIQRYEQAKIARFMADWAKVDPAITESLTVEIWNSKEFVLRLANSLEFNKGLTQAEAKVKAESEMKGTYGMYDHNLFLIDLFLPFKGGESWKAGAIFAHEFGHHLTHWIPNDYVKALYEEWNMKKTKILTKLKPEERVVMEKYWKGEAIDVHEAETAYRIINPSFHYRFKSPAEFWAETVRDMFRKDYQGEDVYTGKFGRLMNYTHKYMIGFFNSLYQRTAPNGNIWRGMGFARGRGMAEQIYRKMIQGDVRVNMEGYWQSPERYFEHYLRLEDQPKGPNPLRMPSEGSNLWRSENPMPMGMTMEAWREREAEWKKVQKEKRAKAKQAFKEKGEVPPDLELFEEMMEDPSNFEFAKMSGDIKVDKSKIGEIPEDKMKRAKDIVMYLYDATGGGGFKDMLYRSINSKYLNTSNIEAKEMLQIVAEHAPDFIEAERAEKTFSELKREAAAADDVDVGYFQRLGKRTANLARDVLRARTALLYSLERMTTLKAKTLADDATPQDAAALEEWLAVHIELQSKLSGSISNIARALGAMRMPVTAEEIFNAKSLKDLGNKVAARKHPLMAAYVEAFKGWLFSNPATHGVNFSGNMSVQLGNMVEDYLAVMSGRITGSADRIKLAEANRKAVARVEGSINGLSYVVDHILKSVEVTAERGIEAGEEVIRSQQVAPYEDKWNPDTKAWSHKSIWGDLPPEATTFDHLLKRTFDMIGTVSRAPLHALGTSDGFFRSVEFNAAITERALQMADSLGLQGEQRANYVKEFKTAHRQVFEQHLRPVSKEAKEWGKKYVGDGQHFEFAWNKAREAVFAHETTKSAGVAGQVAEKGRKIVGENPILQILFPTWKTPMNILRYVGQRTPLLNRFSTEMQADIAAGGRRRDQAYAKLAYGYMLYSLGIALALGGSTMSLFDKDGKEAIESVGGMDGSIRIGKKNYSLDNADPVGSFLLLPARLLHIMQNTLGVSGEHEITLFGERIAWTDADPDSPVGRALGGGGQRMEFGEVTSTIIAAFASLYTDKTFNRQLRDFLDMVSPRAAESQRKRFFNNLISNGTTPMNGTLRFLLEGQGETMREAETMVDAWWKNKAPHLVKPRFDIFGRPMKMNERWGYMTRNSTFGDEPIDKEIVRLELPVAKLRDDEWRGVEMTDEQKVRYNQILEKMNLRKVLNDVITKDKQYAGLADVPGSAAPGTKGGVLVKIINGYRKGAWGTLVNEDMKKNKGVGSIPSRLEQHIMEGMEHRRPPSFGFQGDYEQNLNKLE